jgi:hypothetical protein
MENSKKFWEAQQVRRHFPLWKKYQTYGGPGVQVVMASCGVGWGLERRKATNKIDTLTPYQSILLLNLVVSASNNSLYLSRRATQIVLKLLGLGNWRELPSS